MQSPKVLFLSEEIRYDLPFGLFCLASALKKEGIGIDFEHQNSLKSIIKKLKNEKFTAVVLTLYDSTLEKSKKLINTLKKHSKTPVIAGGPMPTMHPKESAVHSGADIIIRGEAENVLPSLIKALFKNNLDVLKTLPGIFMGDVADTTNFINELSQREINNLHLDYSIIIDEYYKHKFFGLNNGLRFTSSRGCPYSCIFCSHVHGRKFRAMTAEKIINELKKYDAVLMGINLPRKVIFNDDDFFIDRARAIEFFDKFSAEKELCGKFWFIFQTSIRSFVKNGCVDNELIRMTKNVNVILLQIGTDAFCDSELKNLRKGYIFNDVEKAVCAFENFEMANCHYLILTNLFTTPKDIEETLKNIIYLKNKFKYFDICSVNGCVMPYSGTPIQKLAGERGYSNLLKGKEFKDRKHPGLNFKAYHMLLPADKNVRRFISKIKFKRIEILNKNSRITIAGTQIVADRYISPKETTLQLESALNMIKNLT